MAGQEPLFFEDFRGSIRHLVGCLGGPKKVAAMLRPTLSAQAGANWVNDCLSETRDSKFDFEDIATILAAGRKLGIHCAMWRLCDESGYSRPTIAPSKTPEQELAEQMIRTANEYQRLANEAAAAATARLKSVS